MIKFFFGHHYMLEKVSTPWVVVIAVILVCASCLLCFCFLYRPFSGKVGRFYNKPVELVLNYLRFAMVTGSVTVLRSPDAKSGTVQTMSVQGVPSFCEGPTCPKEDHYLLVDDGNLLVEWQWNYRIEGVLALRHRGVITHYANFLSEYAAPQKA